MFFKFILKFWDSGGILEILDSGILEVCQSVSLEIREKKVVSTSKKTGRHSNSEPGFAFAVRQKASTLGPQKHYILMRVYRITLPFCQTAQQVSVEFR